MNQNYRVPQLQLFNSNLKRLKTQRSPKKQDLTRFYSPRHLPSPKTNRLHSPVHTKQYSNKSISKNKNENHYPANQSYQANILYPKGFHQNIDFPNCYLDYEPEIYTGYSPISIPITQHNYYTPRMNYQRWDRAERDHIQKLNMQTQTSKLNDDYVRPQSQAKQGESTNQNKKAIYNQNPELPDKKIEDQKLAGPKYAKQAGKFELELVKKAQIEENQHSFSNMNPGRLLLPKSESSINGADYRKTFSEAILDELFEKDLQQEYEQKYNKDKKFSEVIIGRVQKTVHVITEKAPTSQDRGQMNLNIKSLDKGRQNEHYRMDQLNSNSNANDKIQTKALQKEKTINMVISGQDQKRNMYMNSPVQTVDQSNQNSRNQVIQTDNSQSDLLIERLIKNVIDDKEFRRRLNQMKDQFNSIRVDYQINPYVQLQSLIDSKDAYVNHSQEFIKKLTTLIENTSATQRRKIQSICLQNNSPNHPQSQQINHFFPIPARSTKHQIQSPVQIPVKFPPSTRTLPFIPPRPVVPLEQTGFLPIHQHYAHPPPGQIVQQIPYRRIQAVSRQQ